MPRYILGARGHDYGNGKAAEVFTKIHNDGWVCTQLAFKKLIAGVKDYKDITPELVAEVKKAVDEVPMQISVLGTYVELGLMDDIKRHKEAETFKSQLAVCKALGAGCIGTETTALEKQPAGTTREQALKQLYKSLELILPEAERQGVMVGIEPVYYHTLNSVETTRKVLDTMQSPNLKIIFDMGNLMSNEWVEKQDVLYGRAMESWGEHIMAIHFKGVCFDESGRRPSRLEDSVIDYAAAFDAMKGLPQEVLPVLREEAVPMIARQDIAFMKQFTER